MRWQFSCRQRLGSVLFSFVMLFGIPRARAGLSHRSTLKKRARFCRQQWAAEEIRRANFWEIVNSGHLESLQKDVRPIFKLEIPPIPIFMAITIGMSPCLSGINASSMIE